MRLWLNHVKSNLIVKKNELLRYGYQLSLNEQRILLACISMIDSRQKLEQNQQFTVSVQEISDLFLDNQTQNLYKNLRLACKRLFNRKIVFDVDDGVEELRWVYKIKYHRDESKITLNFSPDVIPYLSEITERFTRYKLQDVAKFKCIHSFRLYELFAQYQTVGSREIEVDEIRRLLDLGDKYQQFGELKRSVIDKAIREINEHSNLVVNYGCRTRGKLVTHFQFQFSIKKRAALPDDTANSQRMTLDEYVRQNPVLTRGKTTDEVYKLMYKNKS